LEICPSTKETEASTLVTAKLILYVIIVLTNIDLKKKKLKDKEKFGIDESDEFFYEVIKFPRVILVDILLNLE